MSYSIELIAREFFIPARAIPEAWEALRNLDPKDFGKDAFEWVEERVYRNIDASFVIAINEWRYEVYHNHFGDIVDIEFLGENIGHCHFMFQAIAPFVEEGSYLQFEGEDGERWGYHFTQGSLTRFRCPNERLIVYE